jgi:hypothetical protein
MNTSANGPSKLPPRHQRLVRVLSKLAQERSPVLFVLTSGVRIECRRIDELTVRHVVARARGAPLVTIPFTEILRVEDENGVAIFPRELS